MKLRRNALIGDLSLTDIATKATRARERSMASNWPSNEKKPHALAYINEERR